MTDGMWDFSGSCAPGGTVFTGQRTFTLGCFQWRRNAKGKMVKGRVQYRVKGLVENPEPAFQAARKFCDKKNAQIAAMVKNLPGIIDALKG